MTGAFVSGLRQCAILVGGKGSRLGSLTAATPKPILEVGGRPFLAWLLRELSRFGIEEVVLLTGHLSAAVEAAAAAIVPTLPRPLRIVISAEPKPAGTGGALFHARPHLDERFLLCNGDTLFDYPLSRLIAAGAEDGPGVAARLLLRRIDDASRYGVITLDGDRLTGFGARPSAAGAAVINAGVYLCGPALLDAVTPECSLEGDVLPALAARGALRGTVGQGYFRDIGVPDDLAAAQRELPCVLHRPALFLDRDGVLNVDHGYVGTIERFEWNEGAIDAVTAATAAGWHVFVVTNQSGVARGYYDEASLQRLHRWMIGKICEQGGTIDDLRYCPYHPEGSVAAYRRASDWRKPAPGMILDLLRAWQVDPARAVLVGDQPTDLAAAAAAGIRGVHHAGGSLSETVVPLLTNQVLLQGSAC